MAGDRRVLRTAFIGFPIPPKNVELPPEFELVGVVETDPHAINYVRNRYPEIAAAETIEELGRTLDRVDVWDVHKPGKRYANVRTILKQDPGANIIVEQPYGLDGAALLVEILGEFRDPRVVVNNPQPSSRLVGRMANDIRRYGLSDHRTVVVDYTENSLPEPKEARSPPLGPIFEDYMFHILTVLSSLGAGIGADLMPADLKGTELRNRSLSGRGVFDYNVGVTMHYTSSGGFPVRMHISIDGGITHRVDELIPADEGKAPYRVFDFMYGRRGETQVIGQADYEPACSRVLVKGPYKTIPFMFQDPAQRLHLQRVLDFFGGKAENPWSPVMELAAMRHAHGLVQAAGIRS